MIPHISSQITFLYFEDLGEAEHFFGNIMGLPLVEDQRWAKIYQVTDTAFIGAVDESKGSLKAQVDNAVLITLCVEDVQGWCDHLRKEGVEIIKDVGLYEEIHIINCFVKGPGNYILEFQEFLRPEVREIFHN